jgi:hypothetical protein
MGIRIEIELSEVEAQRLQTLAQQQGKQVPELAREWLQQLVRLSPLPPEQSQSPTTEAHRKAATDAYEVRLVQVAPNLYRFIVLIGGQVRQPDPFSVVGKYRSGRSDISSQHDEYLAEIFGEW